MDNVLYRLVTDFSDTPDTPDVAYQLANINYRLDVLITIALFGLTVALIVGLLYLFYRFVLRFIP